MINNDTKSKWAGVRECNIEFNGAHSLILYSNKRSKSIHACRSALGPYPFSLFAKRIKISNYRRIPRSKTGSSSLKRGMLARQLAGLTNIS